MLYVLLMTNLRGLGWNLRCGPFRLRILFSFNLFLFLLRFVFPSFFLSSLLPFYLPFSSLLLISFLVIMQIPCYYELLMSLCPKLDGSKVHFPVNFIIQKVNDLSRFHYISLTFVSSHVIPRLYVHDKLFFTFFCTGCNEFCYCAFYALILTIIFLFLFVSESYQLSFLSATQFLHLRHLKYLWKNFGN